MSLSTEPVVVRAAVAAVVSAVVAVAAAFGVVIDVSEGQTATIVGAASGVLSLVAAWFARRKVKPWPPEEEQ